MTAHEFLKLLHTFCCFQTREGSKVGKASLSELRRWCNNKAVIINNKQVNWNEEIKFPVTQMVLFPKHPITLA